MRPGLPGAVDRIEPKWRGFIVGDAEWMRRGMGLKYLALIEVDGEPRGYAIYRIEQGWGPTGPASTMHVLEVTGVDPSAEQALWQWLFVDGPRADGGRPRADRCRIRSSSGSSSRAGWCCRSAMGCGCGSLDLPAALSARGYVGSGSLVLDVADDLFDANAGRWQLSVEDGRGSVARTSAAPDLELDIGTLARPTWAASGSSTWRVAGRVRECEPGALDRADALFTPPRAPYNSTPF